MASSPLESLCEIKLKALRIEPSLEGDDEQAKAAYGDLVDRFYRENEEMVAPHNTRQQRRILSTL